MASTGSRETLALNKVRKGNSGSYVSSGLGDFLNLKPSLPDSDPRTPGDFRKRLQYLAFGLGAVLKYRLSLQ